MSWKYLVVIEGPGKIKKYSSILGKEYKIVATKGHCVDLPSKGINIKIKQDKNGFYNFDPNYQIMDDKKEIVSDLVSLANQAQIVYLMSDCDREGEAIAWHVFNYLPKTLTVKRASTNSITKSEVEAAIKSASTINMPLVYSYEARRILDRVVGYKCSFLTKTATGGTSVGRVQSAALRLITEREQDIQKFVPEEYWDIKANLLSAKKDKFDAILIDPDKMSIKNKASAYNIVKDIENQIAICSKHEVKTQSSRPYPPFTTSTLQQSASTFLGMTQSRCMKAAQKLYEAGLCVKPGEIVCLSDGSLECIEDLRHIEVPIIGFDDPDYIDTDYKTKHAKIENFFQIPYKGNLYKIRTKNGLELSVTPDHPLLCWNGSKAFWKKAEHINSKDIIFSAKNFQCNREGDYSFEDMLRLTGKKVYGFIDPKLAKPILLKHKSTVKESTYYKWRKLGKVPIEYISSEVPIKSYAVENSNITENYNKEYLYYMIGLFLGDGYLGKEDIITFPRTMATDNQWQEILNLEKKGRKIDDLRSKFIKITGKGIVSICEMLIDGIRGDKCDRIKIPRFICTSKEHLLYRFIAGLMDSDGCIHTCPITGKVQILYTSISQIMAKQLVMLFRSLGYNASFHRRTGDPKSISVKIQGNSRLDFLQAIKPYLIIRREKAEKAIHAMMLRKCINDQSDSCPVFDLMESERKKNGITKQQISLSCFGNSSSYWTYQRLIKGRNRPSFVSRENLNDISDYLDSVTLSDIANGDLIFEEIDQISIEEYDGYVYDITSSTNSFIVNGICSHNCTYHRTDSVKLSPEGLKEIRSYVSTTFANQYHTAQPNIFKTTAKNAQEGHEAIRPTDINKLSAGSDSDEKRLYEMIWQRAVASQMSDCQTEKIVVQFDVKKYKLESRGSRMLFDGFRKVWSYGGTGDTLLPVISEKDKFNITKVDADQKFTQPPPRYSSASFVKTLEKEGIGRPSTFESITRTLKDRGYIEIKNNSFHGTVLGINVVEFLKKANFCFIDLAFTSSMESDLDFVAESKETKENVLHNFYIRLINDIQTANAIKDQLQKTSINCPNCGKPLMMKYGSFGPFFSCEDRKVCGFTANVGPDGNPEAKTVPQPKEYGKNPCHACGEKMVKRQSKFGVFYGCSNFPSCRAMQDEVGVPIEKKTKKWSKKSGKKTSKKRGKKND